MVALIPLILQAIAAIPKVLTMIKELWQHLADLEKKREQVRHADAINKLKDSTTDVEQEQAARDLAKHL